MIKKALGPQKWIPLRSSPQSRNEWKAALAELARPDLFGTRLYQEWLTRSDWRFLAPEARAFARAYIKACRERYQIPLFMTCGYRHPDRQTEMYVTGETNLPAWKSAHQWGVAVNFEVMHHSFDVMTEKQLTIMSEIGYEAARSSGTKVQWGQEANPRHWEVKPPAWQTWKLQVDPPAWAFRAR